jgi:hypothetical protein
MDKSKLQPTFDNFKYDKNRLRNKKHTINIDTSEIYSYRKY